jgi:uncharacterized protein YyaL (SSP411 family)
MPVMNQLSSESSPYLLQHQHNPVHWWAWKEEAWEKARKENKMVLISIGYSACHWCHVMEHEVFENEECAAYMNTHFVCIKVDREERPDVDAVYMDAVHLMGRQGGWPLNVFTLPDGRPIYGGTYFPKMQWLNVLENLVDLFRNDYDKVTEYASRLQEGLTQMNQLDVLHEEMTFQPEYLHVLVEEWSASWDWQKGGNNRAPKFPMPNNWEFLLNYGVRTNHPKVLEFVHLTLKKMALGGIYDQMGGGFARYSVDDQWKVPHFEKMLYDNAQLLSVYAQAYRHEPQPLYKSVIEETVKWLEREMKAPTGLYYSALDADSEGVEGKFYTWTEDELKAVLQDDFEFAKEYYRVDAEGYWEHGQNILLRVASNEEFAQQHNKSLSEVTSVVQRIQSKLMAVRAERIRPGLDHKCLTSWNALLVTGFVEVYKALQDKQYLDLAVQLAEALHSHMKDSSGGLLHVQTNGLSKQPAFLDSYAFFAEAYISLYEVTTKEEFLLRAKALADEALHHFSAAQMGLMYFTSSTGETLITRRMEVQDNVLPASNSAMCKVMFRLAHHFEDSGYETISEKMLSQALPQINHASAYSNWLQAFMCHAFPFYDVVFTGERSLEWLRRLNQQVLPHVLVAASTIESELPLFSHRFGTNSAIYVCAGKVCFAPVTELEDALPLLK